MPQNGCNALCHYNLLRFSENHLSRDRVKTVNWSHKMDSWAVQNDPINAIYLREIPLEKCSLILYTNKQIPQVPLEQRCLKALYLLESVTPIYKLSWEAATTSSDDIFLKNKENHITVSYWFLRNDYHHQTSLLRNIFEILTGTIHFNFAKSKNLIFSRYSNGHIFANYVFWTSYHFWYAVDGVQVSAFGTFNAFFSKVISNSYFEVWQSVSTTVTSVSDSYSWNINRSGSQRHAPPRIVFFHGVSTREWKEICVSVSINALEGIASPRCTWLRCRTQESVVS